MNYDANADPLRRYDKFGNKIYDRPWAALCRHGEALLKAGYRESSKSPNLFFRKSADGMYFADMRGTKEIPIWEDPVPLVYWRFGRTMPEWKQRRLAGEELERLNTLGVSPRVSYNEELFYEGADDGYCKECGKDFQAAGRYCSDVCAKKALRREAAKAVNQAPFCSICRQKIVGNSYVDMAAVLGIKLPGVRIRHHVSYGRDETVIVCESCHAKIHHSKDSALKAYLPEDARPKKPKSQPLVLCPLCQRNKIRPTSGACRECKSKAKRQSGYRMRMPIGPSLMVVCKKCGTRFEGRSRTTCPKSREFFR